jgi:putative iron-dependent peroxidase
MPEPQGGILPEPSPNALFLILRVTNPAENGEPVARVASGVPALTRKLAATDPGAKLVCTASFGPEFWDTISPGKRPLGLRPFRALDVGGRRAPNTGGDLLLHILSKRRDLCFELAMRIMEPLRDRVEVMDEVHGFRYLDSRDLTGFIDGTENPRGKRRGAVALIGPEDPDFAGGSFVFTQRYVHDLRRWTALPPREQEKVIGRRKRDSKELSDRTRPPTSHISRVVIEEEGEELEIVRHSFPYGSVSEAGLFFIAYNRNLDTFEKMLSRMLGAARDGLHDHLMDYSRAVTGATFFAPSLKALRSLASR